MRPIPAPRIGESHGLLRAISERERVRLDEFVTEFPAAELFPPGLENALGRTRQFVSYARAAGLVKEDRGTVELTEIGKRYVRAGDDADPFAVSEAQAEWLRRQLLEKHMTDSIYHGLAIGLSLLSSVAPGTPVSTLDFGRSLGYLGRAGWDNDNTLRIQGERYLVLLADLGLIDGRRGLTPAGFDLKAELTLPIHMSLLDLAGQQNPGGPDAVRAQGEEEWAQLADAPPAAPPEEDEWQDVGPGAPPPAAERPPAEVPAAKADVPTAEPDEATSAYAAVTPPAEPEPPAPAEPPAPVPPVEDAPPPAPVQEAPPAPVREAPPQEAPPPESVLEAPPPVQEPPRPAPVHEAPPPAPVHEAPPPAPAFTAGDPLGSGAPRPQDAPTVISAPPPEEPAATRRAASEFLDAAAIRQVAEGQGLRLPGRVYAGVAAALASGKHLVLTGPPGAGKTTLALAIAQAAAVSGRSAGALLVTASGSWSAGDTLGRRPREPGAPAQPGLVVDAASRGKWLVIDELDRARLDRAFGALSTFLAGLPVTLPGGEEARPPDGWRIVATAAATAGSPALLRRFAHVEVTAPADEDLDALIRDAAGGDDAAAGAARRLLVLRELRPLGAGVFTDAARHAAERNAIEPADERTLAREAYTAYVERLIGELDDSGQVRLRELLGGL